MERAEAALTQIRGDNSDQVQVLESVLHNFISRLKDSAKTNKPTAEVKGHRVAQRRPQSQADSTKVSDSNRLLLLQNSI